MKESIYQKYDLEEKRYSIYPLVKNWNDKILFSDWCTQLKSEYDPKVGIDIYIHIPFCKSLCTFCGCNILITRNFDLVKQLVDTLIIELKFYHDLIGEKIRVNSIYIGGGTPTFLDEKSLERLFFAVDEFCYKIDQFSGTIEIDPRISLKNYFRLFSEHRFTNLIVGVQDFHSDILERVNRKQSFDQIEFINNGINQFGLNKMQLDLMVGLFGQTTDSILSWDSYLKQLDVSGVNVYPLIDVPWQVENKKALGEYHEVSPLTKYRLYLTCKEVLLNNSFINIGGKNFQKEESILTVARKNHSLHRNIVGLSSYKVNQLVGLGPSSISYTNDLYIQNSPIFNDYVDRFKKSDIQKQLMYRGIKQNLNQRKLHQLFESIFCDQNIDYSFMNDFKNYEQILIKLNLLKNDGIIELDELRKKIKITELGLDFLGTICNAFV